MELADIKVGQKVTAPPSRGTTGSGERTVVTVMRVDKGQGVEVQFTGTEWFYPYRVWYPASVLEEVPRP